MKTINLEENCTWKVPGFYVVNVEVWDNPLDFWSLPIKFVVQVERNQLFFSWVEAKTWCEFLHSSEKLQFLLLLLLLLSIMDMSYIYIYIGSEWGRETYPVEREN